MAGTPIGGLRIDLQLNSAAFIRDIAKTNAAIASNTRTMGASLTRLQRTSQAVGRTFGAWLTIRAARRVINFLDQSIELAAKLDNGLGKSAKRFIEQGEAAKNAFQLGVAQGFLDQIIKGLGDAGLKLEDFARAGIIVGNLLGRVLTAVTNFFLTEIPKGIKQSIDSINSLINSLNGFITKFNSVNESLNNSAVGKALGFSATQGNIDLIPTIDANVIAGATKAWIDFSGAQGIAASATELTTSALEAQKEAMKRAGDEFSRIADLQRQLYDDIRTPMEEYRKRLSEISAAQLNAADTAKLQGMAQMELANTWLGAASAVSGSLAALFKENKAVAIANAVINTAEAITAALKNPPGPPFSYVYAAAAAIAGAAQIATIMSAQPGSSKAIKTPKAGSAAASAGAASKGGGGQGNGQTVFLTIQGDSFGPEHFRKMVEGLNGSLADGAEFRMAS